LPLKPVFAVGFLSGQEVNWLAETTRVLAGDMRNIEMTVSSEHSPDLAEGLATGKLDVAFMRAEPNRPDLDYIVVAREPFVVIMPSDHRLTAHDEVDVRELAGELFISGSERLTGALLDRLTHHVHILEMNGESYRLTASKKAQWQSAHERSQKPKTPNEGDLSTKV
jgi:LysR family transcriptional regulator, hca operon transcriptional activator